MQPSQLVLVAAKGDPLPFDLASVPQTPRGPAARLAGAAREAWPTACALRAASIDQHGVDPVLLVCAVDSILGRRLVEGNLGPLVPAAVCGPVVFASDWPELGRAFGADAATGLKAELAAMHAQPGEMVMLFAVNGRSVDLRVVRAAAPPAPPPPPPAVPADVPAAVADPDEPVAVPDLPAETPPEAPAEEPSEARPAAA